MVKETRDNIKFERKGECLRCGKCCQGKYLWEIALKNPNITDELKIQFEKTWKEMGVTADSLTCPFLQKSYGRYSCYNYENRPDHCRNFPSKPIDSIEGCGYSFKEIK